MLNSINIQGRLVADPELKTTPNGVSVTMLTVAVERSYSKVGEKRQTDFIDVVAWRSIAEFICKNFSKGKAIILEGTLQTRNYEDKKGIKRKVTEVIAEKVHFAESKKSESRIEEMPLPEDDTQETKPSEKASDDFTDFYDSDLPFEG